MDAMATFFPLVTAFAAGWLLGGWRAAVAGVLVVLTVRSELRP